MDLPHVYNIAIGEAKKDPAIPIFIHDDVELLDFFWPYHVLEGLKSFDVIGLAGNKRRIPGQPAWCQAERANLRMGTWSIALVHTRNAPFGSPAWWDGYSRCIEKWQS